MPLNKDREPKTKVDSVMALRWFPLTGENAARADAIVAAFPEKCSTPYDETLYRNPIDLAVKTWVRYPSLTSIRNMLEGKRPIPQPGRRTTPST